MAATTTFAERFDVASGTRERFTPAVVALQDAGQWAGLRLEKWEGEGSDLPESVLLQHTLAVNLNTPVESEIHWSGHRPKRGIFRPETLMVMPAGLPYSSRSKGYWRGLIVAIDPEFIQSVASTRMNRPVELKPSFGAEDPFLWHGARSLAHDVQEGSPTGKLYGEAIGLALIAHLIRNYATDDRLRKDESGPTPLLRERIKERILDQLDQPLALSDLAAFVQMDVFSFARWFKTAFGCPPYQYILSARIERARELLVRSSESVMQVALDCGFTSHSHFTTTFRRFVGVSPTAYRTRLR
ncbi:MAG TPA: AraC family transcriptional regulator [Caldimonas sp.]|jgi:AraC family transcriptional regulator